MELSELRNVLIGKKGAVEDFPFGTEVPVYKVGGKIFAILLPADRPPRLNLKCDPLHAEHLRACFPAVSPGYHMHKRHWNTIVLDGSIPDAELYSMVADSYALVAAGLPARVRRSL